MVERSLWLANDIHGPRASGTRASHLGVAHPQRAACAWTQAAGEWGGFDKPAQLPRGLQRTLEDSKFPAPPARVRGAVLLCEWDSSVAADVFRAQPRAGNR